MRRDDGGEFWDTVFDVVSLVFSVADVVANPADPWAWAGLAGDVVDLIPFVSGVGEATDLVRVATKADDIVDAIDDVHDTAKAIDRIGDGLDTSSTVSKVTKTTKTKGWQVGDDVSNLTKAGNEPSWTTVRQRYWKNQAHLNSDAYSPENLQRMKKGLAPIVDNAPMELHHTFRRKGANFYIFEPVTKAQHHFIHYGW